MSELERETSCRKFQRSEAKNSSAGKFVANFSGTLVPWLNDAIVRTSSIPYAIGNGNPVISVGLINHLRAMPDKGFTPNKNLVIPPARSIWLTDYRAKHFVRELTKLAPQRQSRKTRARIADAYFDIHKVLRS